MPTSQKPTMPKVPLTYAYEDSFAPKIVCGVDEAGRGPLAGRVYAAAVIIPEEVRNESAILALNDSKKLSEKKRTALAPEIKRLTIWSVAYAEVDEIEEKNILEATLAAMRRAVAGLSLSPAVALIDGNIDRDFPPEYEAHAIVGGDGLSPSIAAASILAKTERDAYCVDVLDKEYPAYGFAVHKGYGTKAHYEALTRYGMTPVHRASFLRKFYEKQR